MRSLYHYIYLVLILCASGFQVMGQAVLPDTASIVFELGEVQVFGDKQHPFALSIDRSEISALQNRDVSQSLALLPGINFVLSGLRNDAMVSVRGFDLRQVPVYIDGVPVYVSYDGYADLGRFLVSDLSRISVSRGETSLLLGPNALGGAINLVSRKPVSRFELDAGSGVVLDKRGYGGFESELNVGSRMNKFYVQAGIAIADTKPFILSGKGEPGSNAEQVQPNSQQHDLNGSVKIGFTPNASDSYVLGYHFQDGSKGVPAYTGEDPNQMVRYWQFPSIRKQGIHFNSLTSLGNRNTLQTRFFYDDYFSDLRSYDDSTLTTQTRRSSFTSIYDDETLGGSLILSLHPSEKHEIKAAIHMLYDHHREYNTHPVEESPRHFRDLTYSLALEDQYAISEKLRVQFGVGAHLKNSLQSDDYDSQADSIFPFPKHRDRSIDLLAGLNYQAGESHHLGANVSRKNRFPTMKDRYSYRLGRSIPNPGLLSETSWNMDLNYAFIPGGSFRVKTSLFLSQLQNSIQAVYGVDPENSAVYQLQNTGNARFYGLEADVVLVPVSGLKTGIQYTITKRKNLSNPEIVYTDVPEHKLNGYVDYTLFSRLSLKLNGLFNSSRYSTSEGIYETDPFFIMDLNAAIILFDAFSIEASLTNLLDANYGYMEGYPAPGRQYHLGIRYSFKYK